MLRVLIAVEKTPINTLCTMFFISNTVLPGVLLIEQRIRAGFSFTKGIGTSKHKNDRLFYQILFCNTKEHMPYYYVVTNCIKTYSVSSLPSHSSIPKHTTNTQFSINCFPAARFVVTKKLIYAHHFHHYMATVLHV